MEHTTATKKKKTDEHLPRHGNCVPSACFRVESTTADWPISIVRFYHATPYAVRQCMQSANRTMDVPECNHQVLKLTVSYSCHIKIERRNGKKQKCDTDFSIFIHLQIVRVGIKSSTAKRTTVSKPQNLERLHKTFLLCFIFTSDFLFPSTQIDVHRSRWNLTVHHL